MERRWHTLTTKTQPSIHFKSMSCACYQTSARAEEMKCHPAVCVHTPSLYVCMRVHVCVEARAALGLAGLADCSIIFGRPAPSLWRASLKSAGSLRLPPLSSPGVRPSPGRAGSLAAAARNPLELRPVYTAQHPQRCSAHRWLDCLLAAERYIFTGVQQVNQGVSHPLSENRHSDAVLQSCLHVCLQTVSVVGAMMKH